MAVADALHRFRSQQHHYVCPSFASIVGFGAHGAIIHYRPTQKTNKAIKGNGLLLIDSGGQYRDGTTDVTRTIAVGQPTEDMKQHFTWVLKGHIALASCHFPQGTCGEQLDALARQFLWQQGGDYAHGTGHGVGSFLNVHEGPQRIGTTPTRVPLQVGMVLSNEPGYYKQGRYGIRIENLMMVVPVKSGRKQQQFMKFETVTMAPIDTRLVLFDALTPQETLWLQNYQQTVYTTLAPFLGHDEAIWLRNQCLEYHKISHT